MDKAARLLSVFSFAFITHAYAVPILQSTGGAVGSFDSNYTLVDGSGTPTGLNSLVVNLSDTAPDRPALGNYWVGSSGEWISPFNSATDTTNAWWSDSPPNVEGLFTFRTLIGGTGTGLVTFDISSDNYLKIFTGSLGSTSYEVMSGGITYQEFVTVTLNLTAGEYLYFQVTNVADPSNPDGKHGNPAGLLVRGNSASVPDGGATMMLMGLALAGIGVVRRSLA
ncbi:MAG TPA: hypothetical protein VFG14_14460 [Chthoniobacteraceae bacterium]|nr:hypothetical protein [Chthoniobacteraceae bacterium]